VRCFIDEALGDGVNFRKGASVKELVQERPIWRCKFSSAFATARPFRSSIDLSTRCIAQTPCRYPPAILSR